jgi:protein-S-isoprenylcysteine O-methyltransferase Ste14
MTDDAPFRIVLPIVLGAVMPIAAYFRIRAHGTGEKLDRLQEGWFLLIAIRLCAVPLLASVILFVIDPALMAWSALPLPGWARWAGAALGATLPALIYWTFSNLGKNLTDTVVTRREHTLVTTGPYRWVRHPFYLVILLVVVVITLLMANWLVLFAGLTVFTLLAIRVRREEAKLAERFGDQYRNYVARTGAFFPKII